jgi:protein ImuB
MMDTLFRLPQPAHAPRRRKAPARSAAPAPLQGAAAPAPAPARRARPDTTTRVVALLLDPLPIWLAQRRDPTLARTPTAVVHDGRVEHANAHARRLGVSRGMRVEGARLRAEHLVTLAPSDVELAQAWQGVLRDLSAWTPWLSGRRQGLALLRATPREARELAEAFEGRVGVAPDRQTAELAAAAAHPGAVRAVDPGGEADFLRRLPLRFLRGVGLPERDLTRLHWLGLATAGDLAGWSREQLEGYLGDAGRALHPYLHGPRDADLPTWAPSPALRRHLAFDQPLFEPFELEGAIDHLSRALAGALAGSAARRLTLVADVRGIAMPASRLAKRPMRESGQIRRQALLALSDSGAAPAGIDALALELDERERLAEQEGLWATRTQRARAQEAVLERYPGALRRVRWGDPYAPAIDHAWDWEPVEEADAPTAPATRRRAAEAAAEDAPRRDDAVPLFAAGPEPTPAIVLDSHAEATRRHARPAPRPPLDLDALDLAPFDLAALETERAERWPGDRGRLTNRVLRAA